MHARIGCCIGVQTIRTEFKTRCGLFQEPPIHHDCCDCDEESNVGYKIRSSIHEPEESRQSTFCADQFGNWVSAVFTLEKVGLQQPQDKKGRHVVEHDGGDYFVGTCTCFQNSRNCSKDCSTNSTRNDGERNLNISRAIHCKPNPQRCHSTSEHLPCCTNVEQASLKSNCH